jgi:Rad3-related DNA helicase
VSGPFVNCAPVGKTLCYVTALLAWYDFHFQEHAASAQDGGAAALDPPPKLLLLSRTHSQLANLARELKQIALLHYPELQVVPLASRTHMCVNQTVKRQAALSKDAVSINEACSQAIQARACGPKLNLDTALKHNVVTALQSPPVADIEDFISHASSADLCPYYLSQRAVSRADVLLLPYSYLLDPSVRAHVEAVDVAKSILLVDEAHNITETCRAAQTSRKLCRAGDFHGQVHRIEVSRFTAQHVAAGRSAVLLLQFTRVRS